MDIYDDYESFLAEHDTLIANLHATGSHVMVVIQDCINVLDYIYKKKHDGAKIDCDEGNIFDAGFTYVSNVIHDLDIYYNDYFKKDIILFNKYSKLMVYNILISDLTGYLTDEEKLTKEREKHINDLEFKIDNIMVNQKEFGDDLIDYIEEELAFITPKVNDYKPIYSIFMEIAEELDLY